MTEALDQDPFGPEIDASEADVDGWRPRAQTARMWDWVQAFTLPGEIIACLIFVPILTAIGFKLFEVPALVVLVLVSTQITFFVFVLAGALWAQFSGIVFDVVRDSLRYPAYSIRRSVPLSEILDANCEFGSAGSPFGVLFARIANGLNSGPKTRPSRLYVVNLSGDFGSRQVRFYSKKRRDQFLSLLRHYVPDCRITRWAGWS